ncbi:hypothetical protein Nepgr_007040 [Nepenthes gracilis]|uniref:Uncharacterized protein n=1 Tax=Nepenthes gracilis TaxID=150966 RepID=A0AAD3S679_NEPGR|nr:hypothetical protein Nepgr_007040 [Nepenthes gracilis]
MQQCVVGDFDLSVCLRLRHRHMNQPDAHAYTRNSVAFCSVIHAKGTAFTHLVKKSMPTIRNFLYPEAKGVGPRMSSPHCSNDHGD